MWRRLLWRNRGFRKPLSGRGINRMFKRLRGWDEPMEGILTIRAAAAALAAARRRRAGGRAAARPAQYGQRVVREQVIIRFRQSRRRGVEWKEGKGPKCIPARGILAATLVGQEQRRPHPAQPPAGPRQAREQLPGARLLLRLLHHPQSRRHGLRGPRHHPLAHGRRLRDRPLPQASNRSSAAELS